MSTQEELQIVSVERIGGTEAVIEFSDSTYIVLTVQELIESAKERLRADERSGK